jgi:SAM-dependent methyltransferase
MTQPDTGAQLRSLYAPQGGVAEIFSAKVADYAQSRPDYPAALFAQLQATVQLEPGALVADLGAGTGLLTRGLLERGYHVVAVEPSGAMRAAADHFLASFPSYRSTCGTAETIPLADASIDLITAAQAFHWFDIERARAECLRVLKPSGMVALIWNDRVLSDPLHCALDEVFAHYGGAKRGALLAHEERHNVPPFFGATTPVEYHWPHAHRLSEAGLLALVFSRSYMPDRSTPAGQEAAEQIGEVFQRFAVDGELVVRYTTVAIIGRPQ